MPLYRKEGRVFTARLLLRMQLLHVKRETYGHLRDRSVTEGPFWKCKPYILLEDKMAFVQPAASLFCCVFGNPSIPAPVRKSEWPQEMP